MAPSLERRLYLPYGVEEMFDLVADIERYPAFVPGWREARVSSRGDDFLLVDQVVSLGSTGWRFRSEARLDRPCAIDIRTVEAPFGELAIHWSFDTLGDEGCAVVFRARYDPGRVIGAIAGPSFERRMLSVVDAFEGRARELYANTRR